MFRALNSSPGAKWDANANGSPSIAASCALYVLETSTSTAGRDTRVSRLHPRRALIALLTHTFNRVMVAPDRLRRQFDSAARLAARVPVKRLRYSRNLANLAGVRDAVLADIDRLVSRS